MHQSHIIEISGRFAGAALAQGGAFRFVAVDPRFRPLDGRLWPTLPQVRQAVQHAMADSSRPHPFSDRMQPE